MESFLSIKQTVIIRCLHRSWAWDTHLVQSETFLPPTAKVRLKKSSRAFVIDYVQRCLSRYRLLSIQDRNTIHHTFRRWKRWKSWGGERKMRHESKKSLLWKNDRIHAFFSANISSRLHDTLVFNTPWPFTFREF